MISSVFQNLLGSFARAGQKLEKVALNAHPDTASGDLTQSIIEAKMAETEAMAAGKAIRRIDEMEKRLLDIVS